MNKKIDNILLGTLWLLGATLGTCFWFNIRFGFNIFSGAHWDFLATQQATRQPVSFWFYFSLVMAVIITLGGLYIFIRPRFRKIKLNTSEKQENKPTQTLTVQNTTQPVIQPVQTQTNTEQTVAATEPAPQQPTIPEIRLARPPRLNIGPANTFSAPSQTPAQTMPAATPGPMTSGQQTPAPQDFSEIREIFSDAKYVIKKEPFINGIKMALFAIGTDEVLYMGAHGISTGKMNQCRNKLLAVFRDTLEDIEIHVNAFVLNPTDLGSPESNEILTFESIEQLREYISVRPNPPLADDDDGNFEAYSEYISTVVDYIGKI